jgi:hypothetical protein
MARATHPTAETAETAETRATHPTAQTAETAEGFRRRLYLERVHALRGCAAAQGASTVDVRRFGRHLFADTVPAALFSDWVAPGHADADADAAAAAAAAAAIVRRVRRLQRDLFPHARLDWSTFSRAAGTTPELIAANPHKPWDWAAVSANPNLTWAFVEAQGRRRRPWAWGELSAHPNVTWDVIRAHPDAPWDWARVSRNPNLTWQIVQAAAAAGRVAWDWHALSANPSIPPACIAAARYVGRHAGRCGRWPHDYTAALSSHPGLTWELVTAHPDAPWRWAAVFRRCAVTWEQVAHGGVFDLDDDDPWFWTLVSDQPFVTWAVVEAHPDRPWHWSRLSGNPGLTWDDIRAHPDRPWDWRELSARPDVPLPLILATLPPLPPPDPGPGERLALPWDMRGVSRHPGLTARLVLARPDMQWHWAALGARDDADDAFFDVTEEVALACRRHMAALKLQRCFQRCFYDPAYALCRRRLRREFDAMVRTPNPEPPNP